ncbi:alpha/beta fold hydrolase [Kineococcus sp. NPDC059986]|uniref:alpha/beta fold hydrolase n=1 Tax=Kineococcus sp. NPDC059986 TaxID=3155538 RepID=UPI00344DE302
MVLSHVSVLGHRMAYRRSGSGRPVVFLHGNPTSSRLVRCRGGPGGRPRLRRPRSHGDGESDKLSGTGDDRFSFHEHARFLDAGLSALGLDRDVVLVGHDWGGVLAVDWARRHSDAVRGIAHLEAGLVPVSWRDGTGPDPDLFGAPAQCGRGTARPPGERLRRRRPAGGHAPHADPAGGRGVPRAVREVGGGPAGRPGLGPADPHRRPPRPRPPDGGGRGGVHGRERGPEAAGAGGVGSRRDRRRPRAAPGLAAPAGSRGAGNPLPAPRLPAGDRRRPAGLARDDRRAVTGRVSGRRP